MSCDIADRDRVLAVCHDDNRVTYSFGRPGQPPELTLSEPVRTVAYHPWSGVGREIAEGVDFQNGAYAYRTYAGFQKLLEGESDDDGVERSFGGVRVLRDGQEIASLVCDPVSVVYGYSSRIYDIKQALGLQWDDRSRAWVESN